MATGSGWSSPDSPCGRLFGHDGLIHGYLNIVMTSEDGTHQFGLMSNAFAPPLAVWEPLELAIAQGIREAYASQPCAAAAPPTQDLPDGQARRPLEQAALTGLSDAWPVLR